MSYIRHIKNIITPLAFMVAALFAGCTGEDLLQVDPDIKEPGQSSGHAPNTFIAFRLYVEAPSSTRAFDGEDDLMKEGKESFNNGLEFERALYFPPVKNDDENQEDDNSDIEGPDASGNNKAANGEDKDKTEDQIYHFMILFDQDGNLARQELLKLDLLTKSETETEKNTEDYIAYTKFYNPKESPFTQDFSGTIWVVLNASYDLVEWAKDKISEKATLNDFTGKTLSKKPYIPFLKEKTLDPDNFLYLKDKDGEYIKDKEGNKYFTMSSSIVIQENDVKPAVTGDFTFYDDEDSAKEHPVSIYVERLQAKYTVLFQNGGNDYYLTKSSTSTNSLEELQGIATRSESPLPARRLYLSPTVGASNIKYVKQYSRSTSIEVREPVIIETATRDQWKINVVGWDINALEKEQYLFKKIDKEKEYYTGWKQWGSYSGDYRIFWAEDPHYNQRSYPDQFSPASDDNSVRNYASSNSWNLDYYSYNQMTNKNLRRYVPENTYDKGILGTKPYTSKSYLRAGSHLIVAAQLLIHGIDDEDVYADNQYYTQQGLKTNYYNDNAKCKILMKDVYWEEGAYKNYVAEYLGYFMMAAKNQSSQLFPDNDGVFYVKSRDHYIPATSTDFVVVAANIKGGDGYVRIYPANGVKLYSFNPNAENAEEAYTEITLDTFNTLVYQHPEFMGAHFKYGMMYYAAGSEHNQKSFTVNTDAILTGDYGTVRNHWYSFTITGFSAPGTPVADPDEPIVPNVQPVQEAMGVKLKIIDWHKTEESVEVAGQRPTGPTTN